VALLQRRILHCGSDATTSFPRNFTEPMNRCSNTMTALPGGCAAARQAATTISTPGSVVEKG
jgi:hypothetical protein